MVARTQPVAIATKPEPWVLVRCPQCGKAIIEAKPGSTLKTECRKCKTEVVLHVSAA